MSDYAMELLHITKEYSGFRALDDVTLRLRKGEVHALLGEAGAGKTALVRVLCGFDRADKGEILFHGKPVKMRSRREARALGVCLVGEEIRLVPDFTALENIVLSAGRGVTKKRKIRAAAEEMIRKYGLNVDLDAPARDLTADGQWQTDLLKCLCRGFDLLVLDEPSAYLSPLQMEKTAAMLRALAAEGKTVLMTTHRAGEAMGAHRCTVLNRGKILGTVATAETDAEELNRVMTWGREKRETGKKEISVGSVVLEVRSLFVEGGRRRGADAVKNVSFEVRSGEIVCITGFAGSGLSVLARALTGQTSVRSGRVRLSSVDITRETVRARAGMSFIPENRGWQGLIPDFTLEENLVLTRYREAAFQDSGLVRKGAVDDHAESLLEQADLPEDVRDMTGAERQEAVFLREIDRGKDLLIAEHPTRGLDADAAAEIRARIMAVRNSRKAVLLLTGDPDEAMEMGDRVLVMRGGEIVAELEPPYTTAREVGLYMAGTSKQSEDMRYDDE